MDNDAPLMKPDDLPQIRSYRRQAELAVFRARAALTLERGVPAMIPPFAVISAFCALNWTTQISEASDWRIKAANITAFSLALFWSLAKPPQSFRPQGSLFVTRAEAIERLDRVWGGRHAPARILLGPHAKTNDPDREAAYDLHLLRTWQNAGGKFRAGPVDIDLRRRDPWNIRYIAAGAFITGALVAWPDIGSRLSAAFDFSAAPVPNPAAKPLQYDIIITPPAGIQREPLRIDNQTEIVDLTVHTKSVLTLRLNDNKQEVLLNDAPLPIKKINKASNGDPEKTRYFYEAVLDEEKNLLRIPEGLALNFTIIAHPSPDVRIITIRPQEENPSVLEMEIRRQDDYSPLRGQIEISPRHTSPEATPLESALPPLPAP